MVCALKRIAVEVHNVAAHGCDLMRISSLSGLDYTTFGGPVHACMHLYVRTCIHTYKYIIHVYILHPDTSW